MDGPAVGWAQRADEDREASAAGRPRSSSPQTGRHTFPGNSKGCRAETEMPEVAENRQTEIPPRQDANIRTLVTDVLCDPHGDCPGFGKILLETGENLSECLEATS